MASPNQIGRSPGSGQGLDARWLEKLYGAAEQGNEQLLEQDIPRDMYSERSIYTWVYVKLQGRLTPLLTANGYL
jgi:hypothetical protein